MALGKKKAAAASPAPMSALAARKAREQAQAEALSSKTSGASSTSLASLRQEAQSTGELPEVLVEIPLPSSSQVASLEANARVSASSPITDEPSPSLKRPRRLSIVVLPDSESIAASRSRRSSTASSAGPSTPRPPPPKVARGTPSKPLTTPRQTQISINRKDTSHWDSDSDQDSELDRDIQAILAEYGLENSATHAEASEPEQPPPKKRPKQLPDTAAPLKSLATSTAEVESSSRPKRTPSKGKEAEHTSLSKTPSKRTTSRRPTANLTESAASEQSKNRVKPSQAASKSPSTNTPNENRQRIKDAKRYFAASAKQYGKTHAGPPSMPVEDQATGFLAFGDDDDDDDDDDEVQLTAASGTEDKEEDDADGKQEADTDSSSHDEDTEQGDERTTVTGTANRASSSVKDDRRSNRQKSKAPETCTPTIVLDRHEDGEEDDRVENGQGQEGEKEQQQQSSLDEAPVTHSALTREALLDAIPYSCFSPVLDGEAKNTLVVENKRKRGKEVLYFGLRHGETLVFAGIGHVEVLQGSVQMAGAILSSSAAGFKAADIYAPISNPLPVLKSILASQYPGQGSAHSVSQSSSTTGSESGVDSIFDSVFDSIVKVTPLSSTITALGGACPIGGLATPFAAPPSLVLNSKVYQLSTIKVLLAPDIAELVHRQRSLTANGSFSTVGLSAIYVPHKWHRSLNHLAASALSAAQHPQEESVVALIRGNKKVGKSTFSRMALERLLSMGTFVGGKVAYLELDVGQSDFGPPGIMALHIFSLTDNVRGDALSEEEGFAPAKHSAPESNGTEAASYFTAASNTRNCITVGPGWCQPRVPVRAHFIGDASPRDDPESYVAAVGDLIEYFRENIQLGQSDTNRTVQRVPLIINTQGWVKGLGADLAARLEPMLRPTHIFEVVPRGSPDAVPPPTRGQPWLDAEGAILGSGPEIVTLESVSQLEYVQGVFGQQRDSRGSSKLVDSQIDIARANKDPEGSGDGGSEPPRYITEVGSKLAPAESRLLNLMSYLYATKLALAGPANNFQIQGAWDFTEPLVHRRPLFIDVEHGLDAGIRVLTYGSSVPDSHKLLALNSSIVAIVVRDNIDAQQDPIEDSSGQAVNVWKQAFDRGAQISHPDRVSDTWCVGLGIVRSIDPDSGHVHLLTPLEPGYLLELQSTGAIGLVKGALELPVWASLDFETIQEARESRLDVPPAIYDATATSDDAAKIDDQAGGQQLLAGMPRNQVPYLEWPHSANAPSRHRGKHAARDAGSPASSSTLQLGSEKRRVRRNLMRKSQFS